MISYSERLEWFMNEAQWAMYWSFHLFLQSRILRSANPFSPQKRTSKARDRDTLPDIFFRSHLPPLIQKISPKEYNTKKRRPNKENIQEEKERERKKRIKEKTIDGKKRGHISEKGIELATFPAQLRNGVSRIGEI